VGPDTQNTLLPEAHGPPTRPGPGGNIKKKKKKNQNSEKKYSKNSFYTLLDEKSRLGTRGRCGGPGGTLKKINKKCSKNRFLFEKKCSKNRPTQKLEQRKSVQTSVCQDGPGDIFTSAVCSGIVKHPQPLYLTLLKPLHTQIQIS
jgi:hypothetical protein